MKIIIHKGKMSKKRAISLSNSLGLPDGKSFINEHDLNYISMLPSDPIGSLDEFFSELNFGDFHNE